jgi:hypothetical protein
MAHEFTIESQTAQAIMVRHIAHGHRCAFHATEEPIEGCCASVRCRQAGRQLCPALRSSGRPEPSTSLRPGRRLRDADVHDVKGHALAQPAALLVGQLAAFTVLTWRYGIVALARRQDIAREDPAGVLYTSGTRPDARRARWVSHDNLMANALNALSEGRFPDTVV